MTSALLGTGHSMYDMQADDDLLEQYTGQTLIKDIATAEAQCDAARAQVLRLAAERDWKWRDTRRRAFLYRVARFGFTPLIDAAIVASATATLLCLVAIFILNCGMPVILSILASSYGIVGGSWLWAFRDCFEEKHQRVQSRASEYTTAHRNAARLTIMASDSVRTFESACWLRDGVHYAVQATDMRRQRARLSTLFQGSSYGDFSATSNAFEGSAGVGLTGPQFEALLAHVLGSYGFAVTPVGQTGDQGVDLLIEGGDERWAIQAKCYSGSVGNDAVQQVFAGMHFHKCHRCAVVTNSYFTRSAYKLAEQVGCTLVDGRGLARLMQGHSFLGGHMQVDPVY